MAPNLERVADALLNTDGAWTTFGRAIERSRVAVGGVLGGMRGRPGLESAPLNERRLAEQMVPQYPWQWSAGVLAGLMGLSTWILTRRVEVAGPAEMTPIVDFDGVSKWYGNVIGLNKLTLRIAGRRDRPARPQRRRQIDAAATGHRASSAPARARCASSASRSWNNPALMRHIGLCPEQDAFYEWMTGLDFVRTCARLTGMGRRGGRGRGRKRHGHRRHDRAHGPRHSRLFQGHAAADQAGPGAGPRAARAVPRRAAHRHRPGRPSRTDRGHPRSGRARAAACWSPATCCTRCRR